MPSQTKKSIRDLWPVTVVSSYRFRLIAYSAILMVFLLAILSYSYYYSKSLILGESYLRLANTSQLLKDNLAAEEREMLHYAEIVRDDLRIQEYMFMVVKVGNDSEPLANLYQRHFGWLQINNALIVSNTGKILLGKKNNELALAIMSKLQDDIEDVFYLPHPHGVDMVSWSPIFYQNIRLGFVAMSKTIDASWLDNHKLASGGALIIEHNGIVQLSNRSELNGKDFRPDATGHINIGGVSYHVNPISFNANQPLVPRLWYGMSENALLVQLANHTRFMLGLGVIATMVILWIGIIIMRNFSRPLNELREIAKSVANGNLPVLKTSNPRNEIDQLSNQFAMMLQSLREKQREVDIVHKELQESAITDSLTGLQNRRYLQDSFPRILAQARREDLCLTSLLMDIDHFKAINDQYGHLGGDECLVHFSKVMNENCRATDYIFRIGGEEFLLLSLNETLEGGKQLGEKIRSAIDKSPVRYKNAIIPMTTSVGISHARQEVPSEDALRQLLMESDKALYRAKSEGRNRVVMYEDMLAEEEASKDLRDGGDDMVSSHK